MAYGTSDARVSRGAHGVRADADRLVTKLQQQAEVADDRRAEAERALATLLGDGDVAARVGCILLALCQGRACSSRTRWSSKAAQHGPRLENGVLERQLKTGGLKWNINAPAFVPMLADLGMGRAMVGNTRHGMAPEESLWFTEAPVLADELESPGSAQPYVPEHVGQVLGDSITKVDTSAQVSEGLGWTAIAHKQVLEHAAGEDQARPFVRRRERLARASRAAVAELQRLLQEARDRVDSTALDAARGGGGEERAHLGLAAAADDMVAVEMRLADAERMQPRLDGYGLGPRLEDASTTGPGGATRFPGPWAAGFVSGLREAGGDDGFDVERNAADGGSGGPQPGGPHAAAGARARDLSQLFAAFETEIRS
ncbi:unnamed protein product [Prorocentrum cordatum]|uniref:Uncharacterized protein n=1 Tax=Prorocentrum cordatum TaxID=2364126 RepID=A0ABN9SJU6_9DINO|nr:unnamed protein product [Polarella glacialis]